MVNTCNPYLAERGKMNEVSVILRYTEFDASLGYPKLCLKQTNVNKQRQKPGQEHRLSGYEHLLLSQRT